MLWKTNVFRLVRASSELTEFPQEVLYELVHGSRYHGSMEAETQRSSSHTQPKSKKSVHRKSRPEGQEDVGTDLSE